MRCVVSFLPRAQHAKPTRSRLLACAWSPCNSFRAPQCSSVHSQRSCVSKGTRYSSCGCALGHRKSANIAHWTLHTFLCSATETVSRLHVCWLLTCRRAAYDKTGSIEDAEELTDGFQAMYDYFKSQVEEVCPWMQTGARCQQSEMSPGSAQAEIELVWLVMPPSISLRSTTNM